MKHRIARSLIIAAALTVSTTASPAPNCGERAEVVERLCTNYGESRAAPGLSGAQGTVEVFASAEGGTWTILLTRPSGQNCLLTAGQYWVPQPDLIAQSGQPA